ncbi:Uncharacterised protein [Weissella viridescens]|uniref:Uncharacterized protein n=1 Tax=Weissella viridescens TaxID=1629 RepID=A0A380NXY2_WEIVI|nr:Uncharacterised protein [Weissella viridescens]
MRLTASVDAFEPARSFHVQEHAIFSQLWHSHCILASVLDDLGELLLTSTCDVLEDGALVLVSMFQFLRGALVR